MLGLADELVQRFGLGGRIELDLEARLDVHERVQPVVPLGDRAVRASRADHVQPGAPRRVVHAPEGAADESGEHEVLGPPLVLALEGAAAERAPHCAGTIDGDLEVENSRLDRHGRSLPGAIRALA